MPKDSRRSWAALALCAALGTGLLGCAEGSGDTSEALYALGSTHNLCTSSDVSSAMSQGFDTIGNRGPNPVVIDRVEWVGLTGLKIEGVRVFQHSPDDDFGAFGLARNYPPSNRGSSAMSKSLRAAWERSVPAEGSTLGPADEESSTYYNFIVGYSGAQGQAGPLRIYYMDADGKEGTVETLAKMRVEPDCLAE